MPRVMQPSDKRVFGRRESCIHAVVRIPGRGPEPCVVRNFSDGGALIEFAIEIDPPFRFRLVIEAKGVDALCEVRHKRGKAIGIRFVGDDAERQDALDGHAVPDRSCASAPSFASIALIGSKTITRISGRDWRLKMFGMNA